MFTRSLSTRHSGHSSMLREAKQSPFHLTKRIAEGEDIAAIWFDGEYEGLFQEFKQRIACDLSPSIHHMSKDEILEFCRTIKVHPAHLVPFRTDPEFSLPTALLELLIDIANNRKGQFHLEDVRLARAGIACETVRIDTFLHHKICAEKTRNDDHENAPTLTEIFSAVLDNDMLLGKLSTEWTVLKAIFQQEVHTRSPLAARVRKLAFDELEQQKRQIESARHDANEQLNAAIQDVGEQYQPIFMSPISEHKLLLFMATIKDSLLDRDLEPSAATVDDIMQILSKFDMTESPVGKAYAAFAAKYAVAFQFEYLALEYIADLAQALSRYFICEDQASHTKRKCREDLKEIPSMKYVANLFNDEKFGVGTLYRRLMDNRTIIAMDVYAQRMPPSPTPDYF